MSKNNEIAKAFALARELIQSGQEMFICDALFYLSNTGKITYDVRSDARELLHDRISPDSDEYDWYESYETWIKREHYDLWITSLRDHTLRDKLRRGRLAWLDSLIAEFSEK